VNNMNREAIENNFSLTKQLSDDPDTQIAAFVIFDEYRLIFASNSIPVGVKKTTERMTRPLKYDYIQHAEAKLVCNAARNGNSLLGKTIYINWFPCVTCAQMIVSSGLKTLVAHKEGYEVRKDDPRYKFSDSMNILTEGGVEVTWYDE
jgi:dCMP deaminase